MKVAVENSKDFIPFDMTIKFENEQDAEDFFYFCLSDKHEIPMGADKYCPEQGWIKSYNIRMDILCRKEKFINTILESCEYFKNMV